MQAQRIRSGTFGSKTGACRQCYAAGHSVGKALCGQQDDARYKQAMSKRSPEARLRAFLALCGSKRVCEHTGGPQPAVPHGRHAHHG